MPVVNGKITRPDLAKQTASVVYALVDQFGNPVRAWKTATDETIIGEQSVTPDAAGAYTLTIPGNTDLNPANTRWRRRISINQDVYTDFLVVPPSGGPYQEEDLTQDVVPLPTPPASNESSFFSLGASSSALAVTGFTLVPVPTFIVVIPDSNRPHIFLGAVTLSHATVATATLWAAIALVGETSIANAKGTGQATAAAATSNVTVPFIGRVPAHSAGSYQVCVNGPAGNITAVGGSNGISVVEALAV